MNNDSLLNIELEAFSGPFDLLLKLIEKNKIDIYDINLEDITNSFLEEINKMDESINNLSEFIYICLLYTSPSPRDRTRSRMPSSA